jgi:hypothetical protein
MADLNSLLGDGTQSSYIHLKCGFAQCTLKPSRDAYLDIIHGNKISKLDLCLVLCPKSSSQTQSVVVHWKPLKTRLQWKICSAQTRYKNLDWNIIDHVKWNHRFFSYSKDYFHLNRKFKTSNWFQLASVNSMISNCISCTLYPFDFQELDHFYHPRMKHPSNVSWRYCSADIWTHDKNQKYKWNLTYNHKPTVLCWSDALVRNYFIPRHDQSCSHTFVWKFELHAHMKCWDLMHCVH